MIEELFDWSGLANASVYLVSKEIRVAGGGPDASQAPLYHLASLDDLPRGAGRGSVFVPFFDSDDDLAGEVGAIARAGGRLRPPLFGAIARCWERHEIGRSRFLWVDRHARAAVEAGLESGEVQGWGALHAHEAVCQVLASTRSIPGAFVEVGVFRGYSAATALRYLSLAGIARRVHLFDTFEGFAYPLAFTSVDAQWAGTLRVWPTPEEAMGQLRARLEPLVGPGSELVLQRLNVLDAELPASVGLIAVANVDVDQLEATEAALQRVAPLLVVGGIIHCDDPSGTPMTAGALLAMERFLASPAGRGLTKLMLGSQYVLLRVAVD